MDVKGWAADVRNMAGEDAPINVSGWAGKSWPIEVRVWAGRERPREVVGCIGTGPRYLHGSLGQTLRKVRRGVII